MSKYILFLYFSCFILACKDKNETYEIKKKPTDLIVSGVNEPIEIDLLFNIFNKIDINTLKKKYGRGSTSATLPESETLYLHKPDATGFYGAYFFVSQKQNDKLPYIGKVTVFGTKKPWSFEDETETPIEFTTYSKEIAICNEIHIGMHRNDILKEFGPPTLVDEDLMFYKNNEGKVLIFKLNAGEVKAIRLGYYIEELDLTLHKKSISMGL